jgi:DNA segregation ATPase FtsK/SpoIIIE-like protein
VTTCFIQLRRELEEIVALLSRDMGPPAGPEPAIPEPDPLLDDALAVVTEFGKATPAILQMWLGIDNARAVRVLGEFETRGLISPKGRVRHKAYELRRSRCKESQRMEFKP